MLEVVGFGELDDRIAVLRKPGQSFTCREQRAAVNVQNDADCDIAFVRVDGGYFPEGDSCDYSVSGVRLGRFANCSSVLFLKAVA